MGSQSGIHRETRTMALTLIDTIRSVSEDDAVVSLTEDMGRFFSYTTDSSTVNLWPVIIEVTVLGLLALAVIPLYQLLTTGSYSNYSQSKNYYSEESQGYRAVDENTIHHILEFINSGVMAQKMKEMAGKARDGVNLVKQIVTRNQD